MNDTRRILMIFPTTGKCHATQKLILNQYCAVMKGKGSESDFLAMNLQLRHFKLCNLEHVMPPLHVSVSLPVK
jgi:hypothetical protein